MDSPLDRTCPKCSKAFRVPSELGRHLARKRPCKPVVDDQLPALQVVAQQYVCHFCNRAFQQAGHVKRHQRTSCPIAPGGKNGTGGMELLYQHVEATHQTRIEEQERRIQALEALVARQQASMNSNAFTFAGASGGDMPITINGDHAQVLHMDVKVYNTSPNSFGQEEVGHVQQGDMYKVFEEVAPRGPIDPTGSEAMLNHFCRQLITKAAMMIYSDPEHPENITCYLPKKTDSSAMTFGEHGWTLQPVNIVFPPMIQKSVNLLFARQPVPGVGGCPEAAYTPLKQATFGQLLKYIGRNEDRLVLAADSTLRPILVRNHELRRSIQQAIASCHTNEFDGLASSHAVSADGSPEDGK